jgi:hypothetical protein
MDQELAIKLNESQSKWLQSEKDIAAAKDAYYRQIETSYDLLKTHNLHKEELLMLLLKQTVPAQAQQVAAAPTAPADSGIEITEVKREDNLADLN